MKASRYMRDGYRQGYGQGRGFLGDDVTNLEVDLHDSDYEFDSEASIEDMDYEHDLEVSLNDKDYENELEDRYDYNSHE